MSKKLLPLAILCASMISSSGCASSRVIKIKSIREPVEGQDISCDAKGCWMSYWYLENFLQVKIESTKDT